jgi:hypothetical protein
MSDPRTSGLILMAVAISAFLGTTSQALPPVTFFPALILFAVGAIKFMRSNGEALAKADQRIAKKLNPTIRENRHAQGHAERIAANRGQALSAIDAADEDPERAARLASGALPDAIELDASESDFVVNTDVSFPVEVQTGDALADQLQKLNRLMAQGVLTEEEYAVAKTKLLS